MKLVMTLLAHDEADIVGDQIAFHLAAGVDFVIATDHRSSDGTTEILEGYAREGRLHLIREQSERVRQSEWVTRMARLAAGEHGADWVINSDADEFWWPRSGSLKDVFAAVPPQIGVVRAVVRPFVPRPGDGWFADRMTVRLTLSAALNDPSSSFRHVAKVAHRGHPEVVVEQGNHVVSGVELTGLPWWFPIELFHFPLRSAKQLGRRRQSGWPGHLRGDHARWDAYDQVALDDAAVVRGLRERSLVVDTRLQEALARRAGAGSSAVADVSRAIDGAVLLEAELVRLTRRSDELRRRIYGSRRR